MVEPSALTPRAMPAPKSTMPVPAVQRKTSPPLLPAITEPSALMPMAPLEVVPGRKPSPTMPEPEVQRNACELLKPMELAPATIEPSALTPLALLDVAPGRTPSPTMLVPADQRKALT